MRRTLRSGLMKIAVGRFVTYFLMERERVGLHQGGMMRLWIGLFLLFTGHAHATEWAQPAVECGDIAVDLRNVGGSLHGIENTNQGRSNLCAQYTTGQVLDAWRNQQGELNAKERTSPLALAVDYAADSRWPLWIPVQNTTDPLSNRSGRWGGTVCPLVNYARNEGVCENSGLFKIFEADGVLNSGEAADRAGKIYALLFTYAFAKPAVRKTLQQSVPQAMRDLLSKSDLSLRSMLPSEEEIQSALLRSGGSPYEVLRILAFDSCAKNRTRPLAALPSCRSAVFVGLDSFGEHPVRDVARTSRASTRLKSLLLRPKALPVAIAYCASVLDEGLAYRGHSIVSDHCSAHWSAVIGMKTIGGACHFLVRSTADLEGKYLSSDWTRDGLGDTWVEAKSLERSMSLMQWLQP